MQAGGLVGGLVRRWWKPGWLVVQKHISEVPTFHTQPRPDYPAFALLCWPNQTNSKGKQSTNIEHPTFHPEPNYCRRKRDNFSSSKWQFWSWSWSAIWVIYPAGVGLPKTRSCKIKGTFFNISLIIFPNNWWYCDQHIFPENGKDLERAPRRIH